MARDDGREGEAERRHAHDDLRLDRGEACQEALGEHLAERLDDLQRGLIGDERGDSV